MYNYNDIIEKLKNREPFAFNRFNDGEMKAILNTGGSVSRGDQDINEALSQGLVEALKHSQHNYIKGRPCSLCYPKYNIAFDQLNTDDHTTLAVVLINRNYETTMIKIPELFSLYKKIYWVGNENHNVENVEDYIEKKIEILATVNSKNGFDDYEKVKNKYKKIEKGSLVLISCGPCERLLVYWYYKNNPENTYLSMGSFFDPLTRNVYHKYHKNKIKTCKECN